MHDKYMKMAYEEALKAYDKGEVPIGAVIVKDHKVISKAHNLVETNMNPLLHAEVIAIKKAVRLLGDWRLNGATLYVTLEPCMMCSGAILESRISTVVFSDDNPENGYLFSNSHHIEDYTIHKTIVKQEKIPETQELLNRFFIKSRQE